MARRWKHGWIPLNAEAKAFVAGKGSQTYVADFVGGVPVMGSVRTDIKVVKKPKKKFKSGLFIRDFVGGVPVYGKLPKD